MQPQFSKLCFLLTPKPKLQSMLQYNKWMFFALAAVVSPSFGQCEFVGISVSSSDSGYVQLYHPAFFLFGADENTGGFDNLCHWTVTTMDGDIVQDTITTGWWETQSFMLFDHTVSVTDSMQVSLTLTSPVEAQACCCMDTLVWAESEVVGSSFGNWAVLNPFNAGVHCDVTSVALTATGPTRPSLFPQPATTHFTIASTAEIAEIWVYNLLGERVSVYSVHRRQQQFSVGHLPAGHYVVLTIDQFGRKQSSLPLVVASASHR